MRKKKSSSCCSARPFLPGPSDNNLTRWSNLLTSLSKLVAFSCSTHKAHEFLKTSFFLPSQDSLTQQDELDSTELGKRQRRLMLIGGPIHSDSDWSASRSATLIFGSACDLEEDQEETQNETNYPPASQFLIFAFDIIRVLARMNSGCMHACFSSQILHKPV